MPLSRKLLALVLAPLLAFTVAWTPAPAPTTAPIPYDVASEVYGTGPCLTAPLSVKATPASR